MDKSLAMKVTEMTKQVIAAQEEGKRRQKQRAEEVILYNFERIITKFGKTGEPLFIYGSKGLRILKSDLYGDELWEGEAEAAAARLGIEIGDEGIPAYPYVLSENNVSAELKRLLDMYNVMIKDYNHAETTKALEDCDTVLTELNELNKSENCEVLNVGEVKVFFESRSNSKIYDKCAFEKMREKGFDAEINNGFWIVKAIQEESKTVPEEDEDE